jgi:hypothetical protein
MSKPDGFTLDDWARILGAIVLLAFCLALTTTPGLVVEYLHRDGYSRTDAEVLSESGRSKSIQLRLAGTGEAVTLSRSGFGHASKGMRVAVWYNAQARSVQGITLYDRRVISATGQRELTDGPVAIGWVLATLVLGALGAYLIGRPTPAWALKRPGTRRS